MQNDLNLNFFQQRIIKKKKKRSEILSMYKVIVQLANIN